MLETTGSKYDADSYVKMQVRCPKCGEEMILHVGLSLGQVANGSVECIECKNNLIPLVPGPIVGGPFRRTSA